MGGVGESRPPELERTELLVNQISGPLNTHTRARVNTRFPSDQLARQAAIEIEQAGVKCTVPVWEECTPGRAWLVQITCPRELSDGVDPVEAVRVHVERTVHRHDGVVVHDVPKFVVVPGASHSLRPGGAPFVGQLPRAVIAAFERTQQGHLAETECDAPLFDYAVASGPGTSQQSRTTAQGGPR